MRKISIKKRASNRRKKKIKKAIKKRQAAFYRTKLGQQYLLKIWFRANGQNK